MTCRRMTEAEIAASDAAYRQWWLWFLTLGLLAARPEHQLEPEAG